MSVSHAQDYAPTADGKCQIWTGSPWDKKVLETLKLIKQPTLFEWSGSCKNNRADGYGVLRATFGGSFVAEYIGMMKEGRISGFGRLNRLNTTIYEGNFTDGNINGICRIVDYKEETVFDGVCKNKTMFYGTMSFPEGNKIEGRWKDDLPLGRAIRTNENGDTVEGEFTGGVPVGNQNIRIFSDGRTAIVPAEALKKK